MSHRTITRVTNTAACLLAGLAAVFASPALAQDDPAALEKAKLEQRRADVEVRRAQAQAFVPAGTVGGGAAHPSSGRSSWWSSTWSTLTARLRPAPPAPSLSEWLRDLDTDFP